MSISQTVLSVARLISMLQKFDPKKSGVWANRNARENYVKNVLDSNLKTDQDRQAFIRLMKAMLLLTAGGSHVEYLRDPDSISRHFREEWSDVVSEPVKFILSYLRVPLWERIKQEDYEDAKNLLPIIGSSTVSRQEVWQAFSNSNLPQMEPRIGTEMTNNPWMTQVTTTLYRGMNQMSDNVIHSLTKTGASWGLMKGFSTTREEQTAVGFSKQRTPNRIVLEMSNPDRIGLVADELSVYNTEKEIIISANMEINNFKLNFELTPKDDIWAIGAECTRDGLLIQFDNETLLMVEGEDDVADTLDHIFTGGLLPVESKKHGPLKLELVPRSSVMRAFGTIRKSEQ